MGYVIPARAKKCFCPSRLPNLNVFVTLATRRMLTQMQMPPAQIFTVQQQPMTTPQVTSLQMTKMKETIPTTLIIQIISKINRYNSTSRSRCRHRSTSAAYIDLIEQPEKKLKNYRDYLP